jgi:hypothetical protein
MSDRRPLRSPPTAVPIFRIATLLVMLGVIGLTVYNLQQRAADNGPASGGRQYAEMTGENDKSGDRTTETIVEKPAAKKANRKPAPDENAEQQKTFRRRAEAILDKSLTIHRFEMPAYWQVMDWVESQSLADLQARSLPQLPFQDYILHSGKNRGRPVRVALEIRQAQSIDVKDPNGKQRKVYELWGMPTDLSRYWYVVVAPELPRGFPLGRNLGVTTTVYGYYFKLQGYHQLDAKPGARPLFAPLIIGRVAPVTVAAAPPPSYNPLSGIILAVGGVLLVVVVAGWVIAARRKTGTRTAASFALPEEIEDETADGGGAAGVKDE